MKKIFDLNCSIRNLKKVKKSRIITISKVFTL